jgi:two-component system CheB/CheR fusion protein
MHRLALVEDSADNRLLVCALLQDRYTIDEYETGRAAIAAIKKQPPDVVLLDITLPDMDGTEVLGALRAEAALRALPVIALTGHAKAGDRERFLNAGFDDYLSKPITDEQQLMVAVERLLPPEAKRA